MRKLITERGHHFKLVISYTQHDLPMAAIDMPHASVAVLQALSPDAFKDVIKPGSDRRMLGFRYDDRPESGDEYSRYHEALDDHWQKLKAKQEIWHLERAKSGLIQLTISGAHWSMSRADPPTLTGQTGAEFAEKHLPPIVLEGDQIEAFLWSLLKLIPDRNTDIRRSLRLSTSRKHVQRDVSE